MTDFAHTPGAQVARQEKAKTLARWCYARGISGDLLELDPTVLRALARRAGVNPPHQAGPVSPTWQLVGELLTTRPRWDARHGHTAPPAAACAPCAAAGSCAHHAVDRR